ncbi:hypothetical protein SAMN06265348_10677 [Pedobacter westerhofensis]|uniref:Uncharacterized protein n=1 Tax=Pedobacter westerhofensis TaxID=425512 RepID=A0A521DRA2_9SPHI|nr:hypothetical protein SAMN06265348_10677 [Pedobacter westerhofensis]
MGAMAAIVLVLWGNLKRIQVYLVNKTFKYNIFYIFFQIMIFSVIVKSY